ncbi:arginine--tRNA ligase [Segetibacter aerophilus]|uniref:Arginine--tRNA ligase n=1 Tax=Segetibacter aerophilus TaxID=670293 RepID=A0A512B7T0_9BACT|nr:arginine--tRNA ligase [Segetibacter aerophilus]GEO08014.1 arginine--tRNA ligase [Segetibacter aerophilus]
MSVVSKIKQVAAVAITALYNFKIDENQILVNATKPEFEGEYTIVLFAFVKQLKKSPEALGKELGKFIVEANPGLFVGHNVIKGFLNLSIAPAYWTDFLHQEFANETFGKSPAKNKKVMVEYSSPNTNKPLHLGHLRNNFLGWSTAAILKASGNEVIKTCIVNDRGIHICKSMIAWQKHAKGATPESTGKKGDHLVGDYYVRFEEDLKAEAANVYDQLESRELEGFTKEEENKIMLLVDALEHAERSQNKEKYNEIKSQLIEIARNNTPIMKEAKQMLLKWEQGDEEILALWRKMNSWVYAGFDKTYERIGSDFDKIYYESDLYLLGKDIVEEGLQKGVLFRKDDGSVWIDLTADGLDEKLVLRRDGTSVYITQDLGLAQLKYKEYGIDESIYVVGDEQNYHLKVLKLILQKLGAPYANGITHLSYGMVELPTGKMKSREGTVVDADDLVDTMIEIAKQKTKEQGKTEGFTEAELTELYETIGLGALKFFLLRVDPKKKMIFNPEESIELQGFTGPFVQYTHARIKSILRKEMPKALPLSPDLLRLEKDIIISLEQFTTVIEEAGNDHDPSKIAIYVFNLAKTFNSFYTEHSIANAETEEKKELRLQLAVLTARTIKIAMGLLGIPVPERM